MAAAPLSDTDMQDQPISTRLRPHPPSGDYPHGGGNSSSKPSSARPGTIVATPTRPRRATMDSASASLAAASSAAGHHHQHVISIRRTKLGFGFTPLTRDVFFGATSSAYTLQHFVSGIDVKGPAWAAGLRRNDLITKINGKPVAGRFNSEVVQMILQVRRRFIFICFKKNFTIVNCGGARWLNTYLLVRVTTFTWRELSRHP